MEISFLAVSSLVSFIFRLTVCSAKRENENNYRILYPFCIPVLLPLYARVTYCMAPIDPILTSYMAHIVFQSYLTQFSYFIPLKPAALLILYFMYYLHCITVKPKVLFQLLPTETYRIAYIVSQSKVLFLYYFILLEPINIIPIIAALVPRPILSISRHVCGAITLIFFKSLLLSDLQRLYHKRSSNKHSFTTLLLY